MTEIEFKDQVFTFGQFSNKMLQDFFDYWSEPNCRGKMRWQLEKTWDLSRRIKRWFNNQNKFGGVPVQETIAKKQITYEEYKQPVIKYDAEAEQKAILKLRREAIESYFQALKRGYRRETYPYFKEVLKADGIINGETLEDFFKHAVITMENLYVKSK